MNSASIPPRFVPTLTDVVLLSENDGVYTVAVPANVSPSELEDRIIQRVMQRVDMVLERRLREAVGAVILSHTQTLGPRLRSEIEQVVQESVRQALAQERHGAANAN